jgi:hypothetical protein
MSKAKYILKKDGTLHLANGEEANVNVFFSDITATGTPFSLSGYLMRRQIQGSIWSERRVHEQTTRNGE